MADRVYKITDTGKEVAAGEDTAIPSDYRRLLGGIGDNTHFDVIRGCLRQYPDSLLEEWLGELEELGFIESVATGTALDLDFTAYFKQQPASAAPVLAQDAPELDRTARLASETLTRTGLFLATERIRNRPPVTKPPAQTHVLIVEDDPDQLALADLRVSMAGYNVRVARSAAEFVNEIRTQAPPDVVLLDVMLPDGNGFDILAKVRHHPKLALLPVVMLTAKVEAEDVRKGLTLGADAYLTKPYSKTILTDAIRKVLRSR
jgi:two-component system OmpR family response regulator